MSFTEEKREAIRKYMLNKIREDDSQFLRKTADNFGVSETSVRRYAAACLDAGVIEKNETGRCGYRLKETSVHLDYEKHGNDALHGCDHGVSGLKPLKYRYGGDVFILSLIVSLLLPYSRKWMWVYIIVVLVSRSDA